MQFRDSTDFSFKRGDAHRQPARRMLYRSCRPGLARPAADHLAYLQDLLRRRGCILVQPPSRRGHKFALHGQNSSWNALHSENEQTSYRKIVKSKMFLARTASINLVDKRSSVLTAVVYHIRSTAYQLIAVMSFLAHGLREFCIARDLHYRKHISQSISSLK